MSEEAPYGQLRQRVRRGDTLFGFILAIPAVRTARAVSRSGGDFVIIDTEHNSLGAESVHDLVLATAGTRCTPLVRASEPTHTLAKPPLDSGAGGIFVPHVETAEQAAAAVAIARYPPAGDRGVAPYYALERWQLTRDEYLARANEATVVAVIIESVTGIDALPEILAVDGVDVVAIARGDLAASVGRIGHEDHPDVVEQVTRAEALLRASGMAMSEVARRPDEVPSLVARGYRMITLGTDIATLANAAAASVRAAHGIAAPEVARTI